MCIRDRFKGIPPFLCQFIIVRKILKECIDGEDKKKPLTDDELADILKEKGYPIARRTVAKYRQQLNIPVARLRK